MPIDDPLDVFEQQYMRDEQKLSMALAKVFAKLGYPGGGLASEILMNVADALFDHVSTEERVGAMWNLFKQEFSNVETTKASHTDVQKAIQLSFLYDRYERDDAKRARYVKLIGSAVRGEEQIQDVASFIQTIEQLNERDLTVLRVLNRVMNKVGDWKPAPTTEGTATVHPNNFIQRASELSEQIAVALHQSVAKSWYSREQGYSICNRLQGFGLAHEIETQQRELPLTNYCFRLSIQGTQLLKLLGEEVPNYEYYRSASIEHR